MSRVTIWYKFNEIVADGCSVLCRPTKVISKCTLATVGTALSSATNRLSKACGVFARKFRKNWPSSAVTAARSG